MEKVHINAMPIAMLIEKTLTGLVNPTQIRMATHARARYDEKHCASQDANQCKPTPIMLRGWILITPARATASNSRLSSNVLTSENIIVNLSID